MIAHSFEIVINTEFGGFSLDTEMAVWLMENRGWRVSKTDSTCDLEHDLVEMGADRFVPTDKHVQHYDDTKFRMNQDLIDCVRDLQATYYRGPGWREAKVNCLEVKTINVHIDVEEYHDGKEEINCRAEEV
jgi:hypothetical protein